MKTGAVPATYLCTSPHDLENTVGAEILSDDLVRGLRQINSNLCVPLPEHYEFYYPLQRAGITCLWLGKPGEGRKITAFRLGPVPEFTQLTSEGGLLCKGWRAVFEKVVAAHAATKAQIEAKFQISLNRSGNDASCGWCRRDGKIKRATSASGLCTPCDSLRKKQAAISAWQAEVIEEAKKRAMRPPRTILT